MSVFIPGGDLALASPHLQRRLAVAAAADLDQLGQALLLAWARQDSFAIRSSRHALSGLCRVIGADDLEQAALGSLVQAEDIARFTALMACVRTALEGLASAGPERVAYVD